VILVALKQELTDFSCKGQDSKFRFCGRSGKIEDII
jgi:hypothetical protein